MFKDKCGLIHTAANQQAVDAFETVIDALYRIGTNTGDCLKAVFEADPEMPMAHCLKGYFFMFMASGPLRLRARKAHQEALKFAGGATARERAHIKALGLWSHDDKAAAIRLWDDIVSEYPFDTVALRLGHFGHFYDGDSVAMRKCMETTFPHWQRSHPGYSFLLGMRAFAFEECGDYAAAEKLGREGLDLDPVDPWAIHAVSHVMEMQERRQEGIDWITGHQAHWQGANNFRYHVLWHRALMYWGLGDFDAVLAIYDDQLWDPESDEYADLCNNATVLLRLEYVGVDVGDRWQNLHAKVKARTDEHILMFADVHFAMMCAATGDAAGVRNLIESSPEIGGALRNDVAAPLCQAMLDYRTDACGQAQSTLLALRGRIIEIGGSHAQRDVFELLMIEASIKAGDLATARHMLENRSQTHPRDGVNWNKLADVLSSLGDEAANQARLQASGLLVA
ncbi:MAG: tetratricopeptide repeat protein [Rhodospirillales bacterium]|nr:tetratricopeptide repeat protein [Rhodospirillales bacterium]